MVREIPAPYADWPGLKATREHRDSEQRHSCVSAGRDLEQVGTFTSEGTNW